MCHTNTHWVEALPLVLLGIRSAWKEDIKTSSAELVYGEPLRLPSDFFKPTESTSVDYTSFVARLRNHIAKIKPVPGTRHAQKPFYVPKDLSSADYVFLRQGPAKGALESPYAGPYKVLRRGSKTFKIEIAGKPNTVTIDRLKPAYVAKDDDRANLNSNPPISHFPIAASSDSPLESEPSVPASITIEPEPAGARKTRSGRSVHFPAHLVDYRP
jgi:hypothetical protein